MKHNDLDIENWKELNINTDSLWLIGERDKSGKHENIYHGNFTGRFQIEELIVPRLK